MHKKVPAAVLYRFKVKPKSFFIFSTKKIIKEYAV